MTELKRVSSYNISLCFLTKRRPPSSTLFPYTTLFRSLSLKLLLNTKTLKGALVLKVSCLLGGTLTLRTDRKSTRLNSSHLGISYAVFCLKKKKADWSEFWVRTVVIYAKS